MSVCVFCRVLGRYGWLGTSLQTIYTCKSLDTTLNALFVGSLRSGKGEKTWDKRAKLVYLFNPSKERVLSYRKEGIHMGEGDGCRVYQ